MSLVHDASQHVQRAVGATPLLETPTLADLAHAQLKSLIFDFVLMPGERCSESELAQRLAISRTPLRQALQRLEREGFLQVVPRVGWQVAPLHRIVVHDKNGLRHNSTPLEMRRDFATAQVNVAFKPVPLRYRMGRRFDA